MHSQHLLTIGQCDNALTGSGHSGTVGHDQTIAGLEVRVGHEGVEGQGECHGELNKCCLMNFKDKQVYIEI